MCEPDAGLAGGNVVGELGTGRDATTFAVQAMLLILGDVEFDFGKLEDLMPDWFGIVSREFLPATSAFGRMKWIHFVAAFGGDQGSLVPFVSRLSAAFALLCG